VELILWIKIIYDRLHLLVYPKKFLSI
jgi:hypothetical protein